MLLVAWAVEKLFDEPKCCSFASFFAVSCTYICDSETKSLSVSGSYLELVPILLVQARTDTSGVEMLSLARKLAPG